jgi:hypothetical protein
VRAGRETVPPLLFGGFTVSAIGGPLALAALFVPGAAGNAPALSTLIGIALFTAPLAIWVGYSRRVASPGGLAAFVESASSRPLALVQAGIWTVSYFLYLPYTVTYVVYDVLAVVFPGIAPARAALELVLPLGVVAAVLAPFGALLRVVFAFAIVQLGLVLALAGLMLANVGLPHETFTEGAAIDPSSRAGAAVGLLFVCASLPIFLGGEVAGGGRTVRLALPIGFGLVAGYLLLAMLPLGGVPDELRDASLPGVAIAQAYAGRGFAITIGLAAAASVTILIVAEYLALSRLVHWASGVSVRRALVWIAVPFVAADAISLIDPDRFYDDLLKPSLAALFLAQAIVVALYPWFLRRGRERIPVPAVLVTLVATGLMAWGFYTVVAGSGAAT